MKNGTYLGLVYSEKLTSGQIYCLHLDWKSSFHEADFDDHCVQVWMQELTSGNFYKVLD